MPIELLSNIAQKNRAANVSSSAFFYLLDSSNIDYRIKGIQENNSLVPELTTGAKYIIRNASALHSSFTGSAGPIPGLQNNDIVMYNINGFVVYVDVHNSKTNQGGIVYNDSDDKLYYYNGSVWRSLGLGSLIGTANEILVTGSTADIRVGLTPIVVIQNYIQTPILMFSNGMTMGGVGDNIQLTGNIHITGNLLVDGEIVTKTAFKGYTLDSDVEIITDIAVDAGEY
jgi:hypothetical protein